MVQKDYISKTIKDMVQLLSKIVLQKNLPPIERDQTEFFRNEFITMAKEGKVNEAENLLYENLNVKDLTYYERGLEFYSYLNELDEELLSKYDYTSEEILQGIKDLTEEFQVTGIDLSIFKL